MIQWTKVEEGMPDGFTKLVIVVTYPKERFFREGFWDSDNKMWFTTTGSGSFPIKRLDAVVRHWSYINLPER